jgi:hypothetical protein
MPTRAQQASRTGAAERRTSRAGLLRWHCDSTPRKARVSCSTSNCGTPLLHAFRSGEVVTGPIPSHRQVKAEKRRGAR